MKSVFIKYRFILFLFTACFTISCNADDLSYDLAFYYGNKPDFKQLNQYNKIVIEPSSGLNPTFIRLANSKLYAYVSLGETIALDHYKVPMKPSFVIAKNKNWNTLILDQSNPEWREYFLNQIIKPLWDQGYRGFFLDTLDSYQIATHDPKKLQAQEAGIIETIKAIKAKYPDARLILNRGFEVLPEVHPLIEQIVVESLFAGWDNAKKQYVDISEKNRNDLLKRLDPVKQMGIPITIVDYLPPERANEAVMIAQKIIALGFNPWVTDGEMSKLYLFNQFNALPRKVLLIYQGEKSAKISSDMNLVIPFVLNHMGFTVVLHNVMDPLPSISATEYIGVITGIDDMVLGKEQILQDWYRSIMYKKIPLVVLYGFGFELNSQNTKMFGLTLPPFVFDSHDLKISYKAPMIGYEIQPDFSTDENIPVRITKGTSLLKLVDDNGFTSDMAAITPWGGYFLSRAFLTPVGEDNFRWAINPFAFFKKALRLPEGPVPDTTTENGYRLMFTHIDGDGFANRGRWFKAPFSGEIMMNELLLTYNLPVTVSIIQGEIASNGLYPQLTSILEPLARKIFALENVEIASHTYAHPFNWVDAALDKDNTNPKDLHRLPIKGYHFNLPTEITGSVDYINNHLAPADKKCKMMLWSGDGNISEEALRLAFASGISNLNPGRLVSKYNNTLTRISSLGLAYGNFFQVFAPAGNEDEVIEPGKYFYYAPKLLHAAQLTDKPHRYKPIDIYLHFYSVAEISGVKSLHQIYDWVMTQSVMYIFASEYYDKVIDFNGLKIEQKNNGWRFLTSGSLRELRVSPSLGFPDLEQSKNVIGYSKYNDDYYVHLGPEAESFVRFSKQAPTLPYLENANGRVYQFTRKGKLINFAMTSYSAPKFTFANMDACELYQGANKLIPTIVEGNRKNYQLDKGEKYVFSIQCQ